MEQLFFVGKAYLKINSLVKTPLHEFVAVERSGLWAPDICYDLTMSVFTLAEDQVKRVIFPPNRGLKVCCKRTVALVGVSFP